jgi:hypothetical protein
MMDERRINAQTIRSGDFEVSVPQIPLLDDIPQLYTRSAVRLIQPYVSTFQKVFMDAKRVAAMPGHPASRFVCQDSTREFPGEAPQVVSESLQRIVANIPTIENWVAFLEMTSVKTTEAEPDISTQPVPRWKIWGPRTEEVVTVRNKQTETPLIMRLLSIDDRIASDIDSAGLGAWWDTMYGSPSASTEDFMTNTMAGVKKAFYRSWQIELNPQSEPTSLVYHSSSDFDRILKIKRSIGRSGDCDSLYINLENGGVKVTSYSLLGGIGREISHRYFEIQKGELVENNGENMGSRFDDLVVNVLAAIPLEVHQKTPKE